ncbi:MAG: potassium transporter TrkH [Alphaproteobacteria bacterium]|nr:MAG: potassium transporter TrkH [Alphaproteobacteria bacterium]
MSIDPRPVLYIVGIFLCVLAITMAIPAAIDIYDAHDDWKAFAISMGLSGFTGVLLILSNRQRQIKITGRQAFLLTALSWFALCFFSCLPFMFALPDITFTNAMFEAVSGLTTTGSTIMTSLDSMPRGLLMWRSLLQWLGGVGIIVMAISILPFLKVGGMQLFRLESSEKEKAMANATQLSKYIIYIYAALTAFCAISYIYVGFTPFDAIAHAMTTIATGGFSTHDASFSNYMTHGPAIVAIIFMLLGCLPFVLYIKCLHGSWSHILQDEQVRAFFKIVIFSIAILVSFLVAHNHDFSMDTVISTAFTTIALLTGTGYSTIDYMVWGGFAVGFLLFLSAIGGCAGSTTCGIKIFRFQILYCVAKNQVQQLIHPRGVFTIDYNKQPLTVNVAASVMAYFFIFTASYVLVSIGLLACGLDILTSLSGAMTTLANVGPGLGDIIGPSGTFEPLPDNAKWIMIVSMLLGRLEFFTLLVFFSPRFWKH